MAVLRIDMLMTFQAHLLAHIDRIHGRRSIGKAPASRRLFLDTGRALLPRRQTPDQRRKSQYAQR